MRRARRDPRSLAPAHQEPADVACREGVRAGTDEQRPGPSGGVSLELGPDPPRHEQPDRHVALGAVDQDLAAADVLRPDRYEAAHAEPATERQAEHDPIAF